jgi:hypothetical protein
MHVPGTVLASWGTAGRPPDPPEKATAREKNLKPQTTRSQTAVRARELLTLTIMTLCASAASGLLVRCALGPEPLELAAASNPPPDLSGPVGAQPLDTPVDAVVVRENGNAL